MVLPTSTSHALKETNPLNDPGDERNGHLLTASGILEEMLDHSGCRGQSRCLRILPTIGVPGVVHRRTVPVTQERVKPILR